MNSTPPSAEQLSNFSCNGQALVYFSEFSNLAGKSSCPAGWLDGTFFEPCLSNTKWKTYRSSLLKGWIMLCNKLEWSRAAGWFKINHNVFYGRGFIKTSGRIRNRIISFQALRKICSYLTEKGSGNENALRSFLKFSALSLSIKGPSINVFQHFAI